MNSNSDLRSSTQQTLREWDEAIKRADLIVPAHNRHGQELVKSIEMAEARLGKNLESFKKPLRSP